MLNIAKVESRFIINRDEIIRLVPVYRPETNFINCAFLDGCELVCDLRYFEYPFTAIQIRHLTRENALLYVTQAAYLLVSVYEALDDDWPLTTEQALDLAICEQMTFTSVTINFRRFIRNQDHMQLRIAIPKYRQFLNRLVLDFTFIFEKGCYGSCKGMIALDKSLKMVF